MLNEKSSYRLNQTQQTHLNGREGEKTDKNMRNITKKSRNNSGERNAKKNETKKKLENRSETQRAQNLSESKVEKSVRLLRPEKETRVDVVAAEEWNISL